MENQNGLWITMRQIHVYLKWLTNKLQEIDIEWEKYTNNHTRINEKIFKIAILNATYEKDRINEDIIMISDDINQPETYDEQLLMNEIELAEIELVDHDKNDNNDGKKEEKYDTDYENDKSTQELDRLKKLWRGDDIKLFSQQLSWIFRRCAIIDIATDTKASWYTICKFIAGLKDGTVEERIRHDMNYLDGNHQVYRDEFEQFKATLKCRGDTDISLFYQIRNFCESINFSQISEFLEFIELNLINF
eukprot:18010_1